MPQIEKSDYLKNYSNAELIFSIQINGKRFQKAIPVGFGSDIDSTTIFKNVVDLYLSIERQVLKENGYFEDLSKSMKERHIDSEVSINVQK